MCSNVTGLGLPSGTQLIISSGSTALVPLYKSISKSKLLTAGYTVAWVDSAVPGEGSCAGVSRLAAGTKIASTTLMHYAIDDASVKNQCDCTLDADTNVDIAASDVFALTCDATLTDVGLTAKNLKDFKGPINAMTFIVNKAGSAPQAISYEQAFLLFGFGAMYNVAPFTDVTQLFIRSNLSGTLNMITKYLGLKPTWQGQPQSSGGKVLGAVANPTGAAPEKTIGIVGLDALLADGTNGPLVRVLAFRAKGQRSAYYPDALNAGDRLNIRDGRYQISGPAHVVAKVDAGGLATGNAAQFVNVFVDDSTSANVDAFIAAKLTPACAMRTSRTSDGGEMSLYTPTAACDCYFAKGQGLTDSKCPAAATPASPCDGTNLCASGTCRRGVCEYR